MFVRQAEVEGGKLAQKAITELAKAQGEIDDLEDLLANREKELEDTMRQGETASHAVGKNHQFSYQVLYTLLTVQLLLS